METVGGICVRLSKSYGNSKDPSIRLALCRECKIVNSSVKQIIATNHEPKTHLEKAVYLPFTAKFVDNPEKENEHCVNLKFLLKLKEENFKSSFLNFLIKGAQLYYNNENTIYF